MSHHKSESGSHSTEPQRDSSSVEQNVRTPDRCQNSPYWPPPSPWLYTPATPPNSQEQDSHPDASIEQEPRPDETTTVRPRPQSPRPLVAEANVLQKSSSRESDSGCSSSIQDLEPSIDSPHEPRGQVVSTEDASESVPAHQTPEQLTPAAEIHDQCGLEIMFPEYPPLRPTHSSGPSSEAYESKERTRSRNLRMIDPRARDIVEEQFLQKQCDYKNEDEDYEYAGMPHHVEPRYLRSSVSPRRGPQCFSPAGSASRIQLVEEKKKELQIERRLKEVRERIFEESRRDRMGGCYPPTRHEFRGKGHWETRPDVSPKERMQPSRGWNIFFQKSQSSFKERWDAGPWGWRIQNGTKSKDEKLRRLMEESGLDFMDTEDENQARRSSRVLP